MRRVPWSVLMGEASRFGSETLPDAPRNFWSRRWRHKSSAGMAWRLLIPDAFWVISRRFKNGGHRQARS